MLSSAIQRPLPSNSTYAHKVRINNASLKAAQNDDSPSINTRNDPMLSCFNPACCEIASIVTLMTDVAFDGKITASGAVAIASNFAFDRRTGAATISYKVLNLQATPFTGLVLSSVPLGIWLTPVTCELVVA